MRDCSTVSVGEGQHLCSQIGLFTAQPSEAPANEYSCGETHQYLFVMFMFLVLMAFQESLSFLEA